MSVRAATSKLDWHKISEYFLPKTRSALQSFLSEYNKSALELTELSVKKNTVDLAHYEKILIDRTPITQVKKFIQNFSIKEMPIQEYMKVIDESESKAIEMLSPIAQAAENELAVFQKVVKNIETSRDFVELETKDIERMFKENKDRVMDLHMMGYDTLPEFRKKYGDFNITG